MYKRQILLHFIHSTNQLRRESLLNLIEKQLKKHNIKYLGVILDSSLSWKQHILKISKSISNFCGIIYRIRPFVNNFLTMLYNSLICSGLNYGLYYVAEVWTLTTKTLLNSILIIQKGLVRIMTFNNKR